MSTALELLFDLCLVVALYVLAVAFLQRLFHRASATRLSAFTIAAACIGGATFTPQPVLVTGVVLALLIATMLVGTARMSGA